ncbi:MAG: glycerol-3-phosphate 1-O-acyltransferase PlsY [Chthonomonadales bacterium]
MRHAMNGYGLLAVVLGYLLGSLPFGLYIAKWWKGIDVREHGSGNIGATNVYRVVGAPAGVLVFILDVGKGLAPPAAASALGLSAVWQVAAGMAAILGHNFSPFLGFKGGKGVSTSLGVLLGVAWPVGITAWILWAVVVATTRYVSLGSILAAASLAPLSAWYFPLHTPDNLARFAFCFAAGLFSIVKHRSNIVRLLHGTENRIGRTGSSRGPD